MNVFTANVQLSHGERKLLFELAFYTSSSSLEHLSLNANLSPLEQIYFKKTNSKKKYFSNNTHSSITQYFPRGGGLAIRFHALKSH